MKLVKFDTKEKWAWRLVADNGETLAHSEEYESKQARDDTVKVISEKTGLACEEAK